MLSDYLNNTVWCTVKPSTIHGVGVFAIRDTPKGTVLSDFTIDNSLNGKGKKLQCTEEEFMKINKEVRDLILDRMIIPKEWETITFQSPNSDLVLSSFMNFAKDPNSDSRVALRDIKKGEEITLNHSASLSHPLSIEHHIGYIWE